MSWVIIAVQPVDVQKLVMREYTRRRKFSAKYI